MPTDQEANPPTTAPAPDKRIDIVEEAAPSRPYTPPTLISDEELTALAAKRMAESDRAARDRQAMPTMITDGEVEIKVEGDRIVPRRLSDATPANASLTNTQAPMTPRRQSKLEAEQEAGRRAVARAMEQQAHRPPMVKSAAEIAAEGSNNPVFRPGDFREYANMRQNHPSKDSGSAMLRRVAQQLPEG